MTRRRLASTCGRDRGGKRRCGSSQDGGSRQKPRPLLLERPALRLREAGGEQEPEIRFQFQHTVKSAVRRVDSVEDLEALFSAEAEIAKATWPQWLRLADAKWIDDMVSELCPKRRARLARRHRQLQATTVPENDFHDRWAEASMFATTVINLWFEDKSLVQVLERAKALGHMEASLSSGCILEGNLIDSLSTAADITMDELMPMLKRMSSNDRYVSMYRVRSDNCFHQEPRHTYQLDEIKVRDGQGSLNTTWTYEKDGSSGVDLMDDFHDLVEESIDACDAVQLNQRLYMIWKFQHYVTSYHQDTHVPPHFTMYNQVSGVSLFHFLPLLVGLYVTFVGRAKEAADLQALLAELDMAGIGSLATLGPGQIALIHPFGSHGVWVPAEVMNPTMPPFQVSLIRAAELFVAPVLKLCKERMLRERWNHVMKPTEEDANQLKEFSAIQLRVCKELSLTKQDWLCFVKQTWEMWEQKGEIIDVDSEVDGGVDGGPEVHVLDDDGSMQ